MLLDDAAIARLEKEINLMHLGYIAQNIGVGVGGVTQEVYDKLVASGQVNPSRVTDFVMHAFHSGNMKAWMDTTPGRVKTADIATMMTEAKERGIPPLSPVQEHALEFSRQRAGRYIAGLGNRVGNDLQTLSIETETNVRRNMRDKISTEVSRSIINKETAQKLASRLGDATTDWSRNLERIAVTEMETAYQEGWAGHIKENSPDGGKSMVAKRVNADACKTCKRVFLLNGVPRMMTLDEMTANGSNYGLKQAEWKATIGPVHPNCHCVLVHVPPGFGFDDKGNMVLKL